jgi:hypothetical protein
MLDFHHFKVSFGYAAIGAGPAFWHIGPHGACSYAVFRAASGLVVHKAAHDTEVSFHGDFL